MYTCRRCYTCGHFNITMTKTLFRFEIILSGILGIVYQQVCSFRERQEIGVVALAPLDISGIHNTSTGVLYAIVYSSIQRVAVCILTIDAYLSAFRVILVRDNFRFAAVAITPDNILVIFYCVKGAL